MQGVASWRVRRKKRCSHVVIRWLLESFEIGTGWGTLENILIMTECMPWDSATQAKAKVRERVAIAVIRAFRKGVSLPPIKESSAKDSKEHATNLETWGLPHGTAQMAKAANRRATNTKRQGNMWQGSNLAG